MEEITLVTALYDINRPGGRSYSDYQKWFEETLRLRYPMVIFTEEDNREIIEKVREKMPTQVFYEPIPLNHTKADVERIVRDSPPWSNIKRLLVTHPHHPEFTCFEYIPIINSKFTWMERASRKNFFQTDHIFWIDAGLSRFFNFSFSKVSFKNPSDKLYLQLGHLGRELVNGTVDVEQRIGLSTNFMMAGFWGAPTDFISEVSKMGMELYESEFLAKSRIDNEQVLFGFIMKKYKDRLELVDSCPAQEYVNFLNLVNVTNY
jgi:hypothetical protein